MDRSQIAIVQRDSPGAQIRTSFADKAENLKVCVLFLLIRPAALVSPAPCRGLARVRTRRTSLLPRLRQSLCLSVAAGVARPPVSVPLQ